MNNLFDPESQQDFIVPVLGILPLLMVADTVVTAATMGLVNLLAIVLLCLIISITRNFISLKIRMTAILLISASVVTVIGLLAQFWFYEVTQKLGIYIPLVAVNCMALAWAEEYALRQSIVGSLLRTLKAGAGILVLLVIIGFIREYSGLSLLKQPAGAFFVLGLLMAMYNRISCKQEQTG